MITTLELRLNYSHTGEKHGPDWLLGDTTLPPTLLPTKGTQKALWRWCSVHEYRKKGRRRHAAGRWGLHRQRPVGKSAGSIVRGHRQADEAGSQVTTFK